MNPTFESEYRAAVHDPYLRVLVEACWLSPDDICKRIAAAGVAEYEKALARLRSEIDSAASGIKQISVAATKLRAGIAADERLQDSYINNPPLRRDTVTGRYRHDTTESNTTSKRLIASRVKLQEHHREQLHLEEQMPRWKMLEDRLADALVRYMQNHLVKQDAPPTSAPAPVVNVEVAMPDEIKISAMPTRETTSSVTRDANGNIVATTQVECDAT